MRTLLAGLGLLAAAAGSIQTDVPRRLDARARYVFYLHGRILEIQGRRAVSPDFGAYEYDAILQALADRGFEVISELRTGDAGPEFARKVAAEVRQLLAAGVPPERVTIVGASKGGHLALLTSAELGEDRVNFVVIAGCSPASQALAPRLHGRMLSIHDEPDRFRPSCRETFAAAPQLREAKEVVLRLGLDHGLVYKPRKEWLDLVGQWGAAPAGGGSKP